MKKSASLYIFQFISVIYVLFLSFSCNGQIQEKTEEHPKKEVQEKPITRLDTISIPVEILRVIDGDTAEIIYHDFFLHIRLADIDAPETRGSQPFGKAAGRFLRKHIEGKEVILKAQRKLDGFGRILGTLYLKDGTNMNKELVKNGYAWHYKQYSKDDSYAELEKKAKAEKKGLWQNPDPIAPWKWRKGERP